MLSSPLNSNCSDFRLAKVADPSLNAPENHCCGADSASAAESLKLRGVTNLIAELALSVADPLRKPPVDLTAVSTSRLVAHIIANHHQFLRNTFASIRVLSATVLWRHADQNPKLLELDSAVDKLANVLLPHMEWEEEVFFPLLLAKDPDIEVIQAEAAGWSEADLVVSKLLQKILSASEEFTPPTWACRNYQTLLGQLMHLEADMITHSHLENHVLKRRFAVA